jgi:hypothetical protein
MTKLTYEELRAKIAELEAKQHRGGTMIFKVSVIGKFTTPLATN